MATYIKSSTGLVRLDQPVTSETIKQALGYLPVNFSGNYEDLTNKPELFSGNYNDLTNKPELFSGDYEDLTNKPIDGGVWTHDSNNFYIVDNNENVIALIDEKGIHSIDFDINGKSVKDHIEDKDVHITPEEREKWNDPLSSNDSELYITDNNGNILALFNTDGLTISAIKTNTINGVDANDLATKTYIKEQIDAINETLNNIDSILEPVEAEIDALQLTVTDIESKTDSIEASENDSTFIITDSAGNAVAQFDDSGLTITAVKTNAINTNNINGTAVDEFSTKAELDIKAQELQNVINAHINDKLNPHDVTAAQVGAYTTDEADRLFASIEHNHDDVYSKLDHTHTFENTIVSAGLNIDVSNSGLNYTVAVKDDINLTSVTAEEIIVSQISKNDDILVIQDDDENPIFQVDKNGVTTYGIKTNEISATKLNGTEISQFATQSYTEENFAALGHNHDSVYSKLTHNHDAKYSDINHNHAGVYADFGHNHDGDYADINHNHDSVYADIDHTHELPTVSEGNNINVTKTNLDYKVALASEIELTKVNADTVTTDVLETPTVLQDGDTFAVQDPNGHTIAQIDESGLSTTAVYVNGKEVATKDDINTINITYSELKTLRNNFTLVPGKQYRITDYQCTTAQENTSSAGHQFDIIVTADSENTLNENARAIQHEGDTYFANNDLSAWEIKYSLDNNTNRFAWADTNGKGVIYYMKDEFNNECPYDFKNILFTRLYTISFRHSGPGMQYMTRDSSADTNSYFAWKSQYFTFYTTSEVPVLGNTLYSDTSGSPSGYFVEKADSDYTNKYTFTYTENSTSKDASLAGLTTSCYNNIIKEYYDLNKLHLNWIVFYSTSTTSRCYGNTFGRNCYHNTFGYGCFDNTFEYSCYRNTLGYSCYRNTFRCYCSDNTFGSYCSDNTFGGSCQCNTFGSDCRDNTFGSDCNYITFGNASGAISYCQYNIIDNGCSYLCINSTDTTATGSNYLQNIHVHLGVKGSSPTDRKTITVPDRGLEYETNYYLDDLGNLITTDINALATATSTTAKKYIIGVTGDASNSTYYNTNISFQDGKITASSFYASSDRRLKENIIDANLNYSEILNNIKLKEFTWKSDEEKKPYLGVIAQEIKKALPEKYQYEFVGGEETDTEYLSVNDSKLVYILIGALQEQAKEIKELKEIINKKQS